MFFAYLSKRIAIPNKTNLRNVSCNTAGGHIACVGEDGLLKVLKLDYATNEGTAAGNLAAPTVLSMNQSLTGHSGTVHLACWNPQHCRLTTADEKGQIIVWMLVARNNQFVEEMVNTREGSRVAAMCWSQSGDKICIAYEDGMVIIGSVDGNRVWGKNVAPNLARGVAQWSSDGSRLLLGSVDAGGRPDAILVDSASGILVGHVPITALEDVGGVDTFVTMCWHQNQIAAVFTKGRIQLTRTDAPGESPVIIDSRMQNSCGAWSPDGSVLAVGGTQKGHAFVQFYHHTGRHLFSLKIAQGQIDSLSFDGTGLKLALAVGAHLFFAVARPSYLWAFCAPHTVVYAFKKPSRQDTSLVFWNAKTGERHAKYIRQLSAIASHKDHVVLAARADDGSSGSAAEGGSGTAGAGTGGGEAEYALVLCNNIGAPVDTKRTPIEPRHLAVTDSLIIAASESQIAVFPRTVDGKERLFRMDNVGSDAVSDGICAITASDRALVVARESGILYRFVLPNLTVDCKFSIKTRPQQLSLNCTSTKLSVIDAFGNMSLYNMSLTPPERVEGFERKDVWAMLWAADHADRFAAMEKARMYVFLNNEPEEPIACSAHLCLFRNLKIKAVSLDDLIRGPSPEYPSQEFYYVLETKSLRDTRELLSSATGTGAGSGPTGVSSTVSLQDAASFVSDNSHPRLWKLLAEACLEKLEFGLAEKAFVSYKDYEGILFIRRLRKIRDVRLQKVEVMAYFKRFDEAEQEYRSMDRPDLAVDLRIRLGDWMRVVQMAQEGLADEATMSMAMKKLGEYYSERFQYAKAVPFFVKSRDLDNQALAYDALEDYASLETMIASVSSPQLLGLLGRRLALAGCSSAAIEAFVKGGEINAAIETCISLNEWDRAVSLAQSKSSKINVEGLLGQYAEHLINQGKIASAIELYRKARRFTQAAKLLQMLAQKDMRATPSNVLRAKKLLVLAAVELDRLRKTTGNTLESLLEHDLATSSDRGLDNPWYQAEALHFFLLAQRHLYEKRMEDAVRTAVLVMKFYEGVLPVVDVCAVVAVCAYHARWFRTCSKALLKLEAHLTAEEARQRPSGQSGQQQQQQQQYQQTMLLSQDFGGAKPVSAFAAQGEGVASSGGWDLLKVFAGFTKQMAEEENPAAAVADIAVHIFARNPPQDPPSAEDFFGGLEGGAGGFSVRSSVCVATGRLLPTSLSSSSFWTCAHCRHRVMDKDAGTRISCPLCHAKIE